MPSQERISNFELLVMLAILRLRDEAYGVMITRELERRVKRGSVAFGSVYATLERLAYKGWVTSNLGEATPIRGGKAKTYFKVSAKGLREVRGACQVIDGFRDSISWATNRNT